MGRWRSLTGFEKNNNTHHNLKNGAEVLEGPDHVRRPKGHESSAGLSEKDG